MRRILIGVMCGALLGITACGDDASSNASDGGSTGATGSVRQKIVAADGGTVKVDGATLTIPAGALAEDLVITVDTVDKADVPDSKNVASTVYDFGPDGTTFLEPVTVAIDFAGTAPKDATPMVAWLDGDTWTPLADSEVAGKTATATTTHFTKFAVVFIFGSDGGTQVGGQCADMDVSCGGDVVGTWEFSAACATIDPKDLFGNDSSNPLATCEGVGVAINVDLTGTIMFAQNGTYTQKSMTGYGFTLTIPKSCLQGNPCSALGEDGGAGVTDDGTNCVQMNEPTPGADDKKGTYTVDGNQLTTVNDETSSNPDAGTPDAPAEYCVKGNTLTAKNVSSDGTILYFTATRK